MGRPAGGLALAGELAATVIALAAATAAGALLFAIAASGVISLPSIIYHVAVPAAIVLALVLIAATAARWQRLAAGIVTGFWAGAASTVALEIVRETGFRAFSSMPGDLPMLMGVEITGTIMQGPGIVSDIAGWAFHFWNGAMFGVIFALIAGGFPRIRRGGWAAAGLGAFYGVLLGTGFLLSPATTSTGAGIFGLTFGTKMAATVYVAHIAFGGVLGALAHRFGARLEPLWAPGLRLAGQFVRRAPRPGQVTLDARTGRRR